ncbi:MAG: chromosome segregation protein SMC [Pedobacter sp.]
MARKDFPRVPMQIKRIEIVGFKSFVDRVTLDFGAGIAAVVGPNGCGKSNVVDAIRWAMGEQSPKNLRGRAMEDVIFGGSESRKPVGMAEVSLVFSNEKGQGPVAVRDYAEFMVTRRLYRNGDSEYLLNKTPCRLLDISELFMDTGIGARAYSIIEQGKVGQLLNAKPEDRRYLIEEAAGVSKFKARKKTALRKIEATRQNLVRLRDIIGEVRRQLGTLKRQARKAEQYRSYREEQKQIELGFARRRYAELVEDRDQRGRDETQAQLQVVALEGRFGQLELELAELRLVQVSSEKELGQCQEGFFNLSGELQRVEGSLEFSAQALQNIARQQQQYSEERQDLQRRLEEIRQEASALAAAGVSLADELQEQSAILERETTALEEQQAQERQCVTDLEDARRRLFERMTELSKSRNALEDARRRLQGIDDRSAQQRRETVQLQEKRISTESMVACGEQGLESFDVQRKELEQALEESREQSLVMRRQIEENERQLLDGQGRLGECRSRLQSLEQMERNLEGYGAGVKLLWQDTPLRNRMAGMVADLLEVPAVHELAVEAVLGDRLQALVTRQPQDALEALQILRDGGGRATLVLPSADAVPPVTFAAGQPLVELVSPRPDAAHQLMSLLQGVFLVEDLGPFLANPLPAGVTLVTSAGDCLTHRGTLCGGAREGLGHSFLSQKREVKELQARQKVLDADLSRLRQQRVDQKAALAAAEELQNTLREELHVLELKRTAAEKDLARARQELMRVDERLEVVAFENDQLEEESGALQRQQIEAETVCSRLENERLEQEALVARGEEELRVRRRGQETLRDSVTSLKVTLAELRERQEGGRRQIRQLTSAAQDLERQLLQREQSQQEAEAETTHLQGEQQRLRVEMEVLHGRREEQQVRLNRLKDVFEEQLQQIETREEAIRTVRGQLSQARELLSGLQIRVREIDMETEHLRHDVEFRYRVDLAQDDVSERDEAFDPDAAEARLEELRRCIDTIGEVNLTAIDQYRELEQRWEFLCQQDQDLQTSLEGLQTAIAKINRTTRKRFRETFDQVNAMFKEIFPRLFLGGRAELTLTDEQDLLETGIEIVVQPPGKRLQNVGLLSGGEKALTAIALIFAIFLIKPSPFCVLDEVDAPLDEANIQRFNEMVREMSSKSQFIVITHSKRTMEMADILFGVTMEDPGISKLVSVQLNDY